MVLDDILVLLFHDHTCDVRLYGPHGLKLICLLSQLVETEEVPLETLCLKAMPEGVLLTWDYMEPQMSEAFLNTCFIRGVTELRR